MNAAPEPEVTLAAQPIDALDLHLLDALRHIHEDLDPVPGDLADRIKFAMTVAALEAEVAEIVSSATLETVRGTVYDRANTVTVASEGLAFLVRDDLGWLLLQGWQADAEGHYPQHHHLCRQAGSHGGTRADRCNRAGLVGGQGLVRKGPAQRRPVHLHGEGREKCRGRGLKNPVQSNGTLTFDVKVLQGTLDASGGQTSLFIDVIGMPWTPMSYAGVARRSAARAVYWSRPHAVMM